MNKADLGRGPSNPFISMGGSACTMFPHFHLLTLSHNERHKYSKTESAKLNSTIVHDTYINVRPEFYLLTRHTDGGGVSLMTYMTTQHSATGASGGEVPEEEDNGGLDTLLLTHIISLAQHQ